jgi:hypothetical protein
MGQEGDIISLAISTDKDDAVEATLGLATGDFA